MFWKYSSYTIKYFHNIKNNKKATFIQFDIVDFLPSKSKFLLLKSINFDQKYIEITNDVFRVILASRKILLINDTSTWIKRHNDNFDIPMVTYDSAQIADFWASIN